MFGYLANRFWPDSMTSGPAVTSGEAATRIEALAGSGAETALLLVVLAATVAFAAYASLHWYRFQRVLNRGESFAVEHPWLDITLVSIIVLGAILTRTI